MRIPDQIAHILEPALDDDPDRPAVVARSGQLTYAELDQRANRWAHALRDHGLSKGDRVGASLPNDLDILAAFHGAMRLGAIWVGINEALAPPEKAYMLRQSEAKMLLCGAATASEIEAQDDLDADELRVEIVTGGDGERWLDALAAQPADPVGETVDPYAPAGIAFTSGTTGFPKGVVHSQWNLMLPGAYLNLTRRYDTGLRKGDCFPLTILNMMVLTTLLTSQARGCAVIMDQVSTAAVTEWVRRERVTVWNGPPPLLYSLAHDDRVAASDLRSLTEVWSGGADCPEAIRGAFEGKFGVEVRSTYGLTEAPTVVAIEVPGSEHAEGSSGTPLPHIELTVRDSDGRRLEAGEAGEICLGPRPSAEVRQRLREDWGIEAGEGDEMPEYRLPLGYWNRPEESAAALAGGFFRTGDAGTLDERGRLAVSDRISLMLNRGGANVYPAEVERVATGFAGVDAAAVFGVPDDRLGERVGMLVQPEPGAEVDLEALLEHCRAQLATYKVPELVAATDSLPRNAMNKVDRRELAKVGRELVGSERHRPTGNGAPPGDSR